MILREFQMRTQIETETLRTWVDASWLIPQQEEFSEADVARAELIRDLRNDLGVNDDGVEVILNLLDQIHGLRQTLNDLIQAVRGQPETVQQRIAAILREGKTQTGAETD